MGTFTLILVPVSSVMIPFTPLKVTLVAPERLVPLMVTTVPTGSARRGELGDGRREARQSAVLVEPVVAV